MKVSIAHSDADESWAPVGMSIAGATIYYTGFWGAQLYRADTVDNGILNLSTYVTETDDPVVRIPPALLREYPVVNTPMSNHQPNTLL